MDDRTCSSGSYIVVSEKNTESLFPMYFGVSCAFVALRLLTEETHKEDEKWCELQGKMLVLGLLVWEGSNVEKSELLQKLRNAEKEIEELKKQRREDAKANEKVVSIFASQEQNWFNERKKLRLQIRALMNELRVMESKKKEIVSESERKLQEMELVKQEENQKRKELEERLEKAEKESRELRETLKKEAQEHSSELCKQKTAFIELVSNQRQLEAELGRVIKQNEAKRHELDIILEQKEESMLLTQKLSTEIMKMQNELEQKDQILSVMLRKSKSETAEKKMLLKEVKLSKAKRKQAEMGIGKWGIASESTTHERHSLRSMFAIESKSRSGIRSSTRGSSNIGKSRSWIADPVIEYDEHELNKEPEVVPYSNSLCSTGEARELGIETCAMVTKKRQHMELDAFSEQLRLKDEKLEALYWRLMSRELESKRLQSYIEGLKLELSQLRNDKGKLEAMLVQREEESDDLKKQIASQLKCSSSLKINPRSKGNTAKMDQLEDKDIGTCLKEVSKEQEKVEESRNVNLIVQSPENTKLRVDVNGSVECFAKVKNSGWRMDLHALGVSYKIKRLKQQLVMIERATGKQESKDIDERCDRGKKAFVLFMSLLNKQVGRYQSLQDKIDDLCKRMHENDLDKANGDIKAASKAKEEAKKGLEQYLEETFQLQRYIVATGQKLMEIQTKIASGFAGVGEELDENKRSSSSSSTFDMKRFAESVRTLFQEVQRGLEVRIARIIGDLEGTLACQGMTNMRRR